MTYTLAAPVHSELEIRKSRFIAVVQPVADRAAALKVVQALRGQHPASTHVCWALLAGGQSGMSDDGEPSGTAGRPMLEVLRHHELDGVLAAVVRYYGGVKLGAGGLVRAYTDAVAAALRTAERIERVEMCEFGLRIDYADESRVRRWIELEGAVLTGCRHEERVHLSIRLPLRGCATAQAMLLELTQGRASIENDSV